MYRYFFTCPAAVAEKDTDHEPDSFTLASNTIFTAHEIDMLFFFGDIGQKRLGEPSKGGHEHFHQMKEGRS